MLNPTTAAVNRQSSRKRNKPQFLVYRYDRYIPGGGAPPGPSVSLLGRPWGGLTPLMRETSEEGASFKRRLLVCGLPEGPRHLWPASPRGCVTLSRYRLAGPHLFGAYGKKRRPSWSSLFWFKPLAWGGRGGVSVAF